MTLNYYITNVFTDQPFAGDQVAVIPFAEQLDNHQMRLIAKEINVDITVFISNPDNQASTRTLKMFSPLAEIEFAGHPIIAAAYTLGLCGDIIFKDGITSLSFIRNIGEIDINVSANNGTPTFVQFSRKVSPVIDRFTPLDLELSQLLSIGTDDIDHKKYSTRLVSCGFPYLIVPVWKYDAVRNASFNFNAWSQSAAPQTAAQEILLFSPKTPFKDADFNARLLGPNIGSHDDPSVGAAMSAFASYLCSFDFTQEGTHTFAVDRGDANHRRSVIDVEMDYKAESTLNLRIGGKAVLVAEGQISIPSKNNE